MNAPNSIKKAKFSYFRFILSFEIYGQFPKSQLICEFTDFGLYPFLMIKGRTDNHEYFDPFFFVLSHVKINLDPRISEDIWFHIIL